MKLSAVFLFFFVTIIVLEHGNCTRGGSGRRSYGMQMGGYGNGGGKKGGFNLDFLQKIPNLFGKVIGFKTGLINRKVGKIGGLVHRKIGILGGLAGKIGGLFAGFNKGSKGGHSYGHMGGHGGMQMGGYGGGMMHGGHGNMQMMRGYGR